MGKKEEIFLLLIQEMGVRNPWFCIALFFAVGSYFVYVLKFFAQLRWILNIDIEATAIS
jgi:hypothetical protein